MQMLQVMMIVLHAAIMILLIHQRDVPKMIHLCFFLFLKSKPHHSQSLIALAKLKSYGITGDRILQQASGYTSTE
jgi:hypothetical protein